jgi:hypothetical protein
MAELLQIMALPAVHLQYQEEQLFFFQAAAALAG